ncbi:UNVERIFIED_CONTAM: hypothetical protein NCL1_29702 [Trichonephila clavipes]
MSPARLSLYRVSQSDRINSAQLDSSLGVHKNCPKKHSCTIHSLREKYEKQSMTSTSLPVQEKKTPIGHINNSICISFQTIMFKTLWFQHDGAPAHVCAPVRDWLDNAHPNRWIGRQSPVLWPPLSPDLTPLDFFLWGHLKELVHRDVVTTQMDFVAHLHAVCTSVVPAVLRYVMTAIPRGAQASNICLKLGICSSVDKFNEVFFFHRQ